MKTSTGVLLSGALALLIVIGPGADSTRTQVPGYGGVLPLPSPIEEIPLVISLDELLGTQHQQGRVAPGRVLYANDRASRVEEPMRSTRTRRPGPQNLVQSHSSAAPNS